MKTDKNSSAIPETKDFADSWTIENALYALRHPTIDSQIWAEAVEWLMIYGPDHIRELLLSASGHATTLCFPGLQAKRFTDDGQPCYDLGELATALDTEIEDLQKTLAEKEKIHGARHGHDENETFELQ